MKLLLVAFFACFSFSVFAQMPKPTTAEIKTPEAICVECKAKIEAAVKDQVDGLIKINVIVTRGVTYVTWYSDRTNIAQIKTAIANAGFDADEMTANPDDYNNLPICCKKVKDGGGKQPKKNQVNKLLGNVVKLRKKCSMFNTQQYEYVFSLNIDY